MKSQEFLMVAIAILLTGLLFVPVNETGIIIGMVFFAVILSIIYFWISKNK